MRRSDFVFSACVVGLVVAALARPVLADLTNASSKCTVKSGDINLIDGPMTSGNKEGQWTTILQNQIKTSAVADLLVTTSLECGLYTGTTVKSQNNITDTSSSLARIQVQVLVDGAPAIPGTVTFCSRSQTLSASLMGIITNALSVDPTTGAIIINTSLLTPEQISLVLETIEANSFSFVLENVGTGIHTVQVQARIDLGVTYQTGSAVAKASIGKGTMSVEAVRLVNKGANVSF
jgi:hypothetical protein